MNKMKDILLQRIASIDIKYRNRIYINLGSMDNEKFNLEIKDTKDYKKTISLKVEDKEVFLFSRYSIDKEIERFCNEIREINTKCIIIVFGFGLGYHIANLFEKISNENKVLIIEPSVKIFAKAFEMIKFEEIFKGHTNFNIIVGKNIEKINEYFYKKINSDNLNNIYFCEFGQYGNVFNSYMNEIYKNLKDTIIDNEVNLATEYRFQYEFSSNVIKNIPYLLECESVSKLENKFKGYPAIVVSAGPSLDKNIYKLKEAQGKAIIISGGRTLKPLLKNGIKPNFVVSIDPGYPAYKLVENYLHCEIPLVSMVLSSHDIIKKYKGKHFIINKYPYSKLINKLLQSEIPTLPNGGSVAHTSTVLANYMGCNPIILVGQDLAFTNEKMHSEQATAEVGKNERKETEIFVEDIYGNKVNTGKSLFSFLKWFENYFAINKHIKFIDATEGGAKIEGTEIHTLDETIKLHCTKDLYNYKDLIIESPISVKSYKEAIKFMEEILEKINHMEDCVGIGLKLLEKVYIYYKRENNLNVIKAFEKLDYIDNEIIEMRDSSVLLTSIVIPVIRRINLNKGFHEKIEETEIEKGLRIVEKNTLLYEGILDSIEVMRPLIEEAIDFMRKKADK
ncbi:motility associated factor glycosyltransferase family protein [Clostridiisalibacter paucivorans]|uniref:motility associated factor glycosyltransferase family protein n=1 Tax=Clostridiisalibacter paucivorans TaxID=408753 RepID=UPI0004798CF8|nr:6-hydroxymethylpterin diphosphokinase MptE-like protein [Clostridiisalibacter paucivorans]